MSTTAKFWQQSFSGKVVTPRDLKPAQVSFMDIPHALAQKVRFNGQLAVPGYTVAQHCVLGTRELLRQKVDVDVALAFLLHEVSEVYLPDVPSPIKKFLSVEVEVHDDPIIGYENIPWTELENRHANAIFDALGLNSLRPLLNHPHVHDTDVRMLMTEKRDLMGPEPQPWGFKELPFDSFVIDVWPFAKARNEFLFTYESLRALRD